MIVVLPVVARGERLDRAVQAALLAAGVTLSVQEVKRAIARGAIRVNERRARPGNRVLGGETIRTNLIVARNQSRVVPDPDLAARVLVLHEDAHRLALEKPSGIPTHPLLHLEPGTLLAAAIWFAPEIADAGPPLEGGLVHRLDTQTSGVVVFARDLATRSTLRTAFSRGRVEKEYRAIVFAENGPPSPGEVIDAPIDPSRNRRRVRVKTGTDSVAAATHVVHVEPIGGHVYAVDVRMRTGRRHQVRAHLAFVGAPIVGDPLYAPETVARAAPRLLLHATSVLLPDGLRIVSTVPENMAGNDACVILGAVQTTRP